MVGSADFFGHIVSSQKQRGMFGVFYDMSCKTPAALPPSSKTPAAPPPSSKAPPPSNVQGEEGEGQEISHYILVTTVSGEALMDYQKMSDFEIVERCVGVLRCMFPNQQVPAPTGQVVSRWGADPFAQMSYSYAALGSSGQDYDILAEDVETRVFFAGEVRSCLLVCVCHYH